MISEEDISRQFLFKLRPLSTWLGQIIEMLETDAQRVREVSREGSTSRERALLTAIVVEEESELSTPERLVAVLRSVAGLYEVVATIEGSASSALVVVGCDSGSDKSFDFLGLANTISGVKDIIMAVWDRVVFYRERQLAVRIELAAQSLPVLEKITSLRDSSSIGPEQAELLRRKVMDSVGALLDAGVMIPEMSTATTFNPRRLMAPAPKLLGPALGGGTGSPTGHATPSGGSGTPLTPEEQELLSALLNRSRSTGNEAANHPTEE